MDQRTQTDLRTLAGHYLRNLGTVAFVDESYASASSDFAGGFYLLGAAVYDKQILTSARIEYELLAEKNYWHTTDENDQGNLVAIVSLAEAIGQKASQLIVAGLLKLGDLGLEQARQLCMANLIAHLHSRDCRLVIYERRAMRSEINSDSALVNRLRSQGLIDKDTRVIPSSPAAENLLWSADLLVWGFRRLLTHQESMWLRAISQTVDFIEVSNQVEDLQNEKRSGPAVACPDPGPSVTQKSEGINRSSKRIFSHQNTIGQAFTQLLVKRTEQLVNWAELR